MAGSETPEEQYLTVLQDFTKYVLVLSQPHIRSTN